MTLFNYYSKCNYHLQNTIHTRRYAECTGKTQNMKKIDHFPVVFEWLINNEPDTKIVVVDDLLRHEASYDRHAMWLSDGVRITSSSDFKKRMPEAKVAIKNFHILEFYDIITEQPGRNRAEDEKSELVDHAKQKGFSDVFISNITVECRYRGHKRTFVYRHPEAPRLWVTKKPFIKWIDRVVPVHVTRSQSPARQDDVDEVDGVFENLPQEGESECETVIPAAATGPSAMDEALSRANTMPVKVRCLPPGSDSLPLPEASVFDASELRDTDLLNKKLVVLSAPCRSGKTAALAYIAVRAAAAGKATFFIQCVTTNNQADAAQESLEGYLRQINVIDLFDIISLTHSRDKSLISAISRKITTRPGGVLVIVRLDVHQLKCLPPEMFAGQVVFLDELHNKINLKQHDNIMAKKSIHAWYKRLRSDLSLSICVSSTQTDTMLTMPGIFGDALQNCDITILNACDDKLKARSFIDFASRSELFRTLDDLDFSKKSAYGMDVNGTYIAQHGVVFPKASWSTILREHADVIFSNKPESFFYGNTCLEIGIQTVNTPDGLKRRIKSYAHAYGNDAQFILHTGETSCQVVHWKDGQYHESESYNIDISDLRIIMYLRRNSKRQDRTMICSNRMLDGGADVNVPTRFWQATLTFNAQEGEHGTVDWYIRDTPEPFTRCTIRKDHLPHCTFFGKLAGKCGFITVDSVQEGSAVCRVLPLDLNASTARLDTQYDNLDVTDVHKFRVALDGSMKVEAEEWMLLAPITDVICHVRDDRNINDVKQGMDRANLYNSTYAYLPKVRVTAYEDVYNNILRQPSAQAAMLRQGISCLSSAAEYTKNDKDLLTKSIWSHKANMANAKKKAKTTKVVASYMSGSGSDVDDMFTPSDDEAFDNDPPYIPPLSTNAWQILRILHDAGGASTSADLFDAIPFVKSGHGRPLKELRDSTGYIHNDKTGEWALTAAGAALFTQQ